MGKSRSSAVALAMGWALLSGCQKDSGDSRPEGTGQSGHSHGDASHRHSEVPQGVGGTAFERELYLTPGGLYSEADIKANGNTVPSQKFTGISWPHDDELKSGDKVCPVTANKADERCYWIVNARRYEFCCAPCLDKFVRWAKERPEKIKEPAEYIRK